MERVLQYLVVISLYAVGIPLSIGAVFLLAFGGFWGVALLACGVILFALGMALATRWGIDILIPR
jgi:hypothetical protein